MKQVLNYTSCASDLYHLIWDRKQMPLCDIYDTVGCLYSNSTIRRALYELRDMKVIYKDDFDNQWYYDFKKKDIPVLHNPQGYEER